MELVDMKLPKKTEKEMKEACLPCKPSGEQDRWPYGLQLRFETEQVEKMPSLKDFKVGDKVIVMGEASITEVRQSETQSTNEKKRTNYTVELQIEQVSVEAKEVKPLEKMSPKEYRKARENK
jgi:hypothetical protein